MMQTPLRTDNKTHSDIAGIRFHREPTFPVGAAVDVDEEDAQRDHQLHDGAQSSPVLGLSDLRRVGRCRQHESSASEAREEPAENEGDGGGGQAKEDPARDEWK